MAKEDNKNASKSYLPLEQVRHRLKELNGPFRNRMVRMANPWAVGCTGEDLYQDVCASFWAEKEGRQWRADWNDEQNFVLALKGVAYNRRKAILRAAKAIVADDDAFELAMDTVPADKRSDPGHLHAVVEDSRRKLKHFVRTFAKDAPALRILALRARATDPKRVQELSGLEAAPYEAARKRIQRYVSSTRAAGDAAPALKAGTLDDPETPQSNLIASHYYLLQHQMVCPDCQQSTPIYAFGVPASHVFLDGSDLRNPDFLYQDDPEGTGNFAVVPAVLEVKYLPSTVAHQCQQLAPIFYPDVGLWGWSGWLNHCAQCGLPLHDAIGHDDDFTHSECPLKADSQVHRFDEPIELRGDWVWNDPPVLRNRPD